LIWIGFFGLAEQLGEKLGREAKFRTAFVSGQKPSLNLLAVAAKFKPCPFKARAFEERFTKL